MRADYLNKCVTGGKPGRTHTAHGQLSHQADHMQRCILLMMISCDRPYQAGSLICRLSTDKRWEARRAITTTGVARNIFSRNQDNQPE